MLFKKMFSIVFFPQTSMNLFFGLIIKEPYSSLLPLHLSCRDHTQLTPLVHSGIRVVMNKISPYITLYSISRFVIFWKSKTGAVTSCSLCWIKSLFSVCFFLIGPISSTAGGPAVDCCSSMGERLWHCLQHPHHRRRDRRRLFSAPNRHCGAHWSRSPSPSHALLCILYLPSIFA